jgi:hypothetical protein
VRDEDEVGNGGGDSNEGEDHKEAESGIRESFIDRENETVNRRPMVGMYGKV